ncbi:MAG: adenylate/guanylate cyclase domain-containing protein [Pseudomonadota bacterium]|nr:adenylate/guanylate cyclase domain-containing protein [Pseudomonadota bacterium]
MTPTARTELRRLFDWLVDGAPGACTPDQVVGRIAESFDAGGLDIDRIAAFVRTLHPHIMGSSYVWQRETGRVDVTEAPYAVLNSEMYLGSPVGRVHLDGKEYRKRLDGDEPLGATELSFRARGLTDYLIVPLPFTDGQVQAIAFATRVASGFTEELLDALRDLTRPLARIVEIQALRHTATNLLSAYVGRDAGERILRGNVQRGDTESVRCVVWVSDLRGFTTLSTRSEPIDVIRLLNQVFDCQVPAVDRNGGQVLKFMGDGMLAIFPIESADAESGVCRAALCAATEAFAALDAVNKVRVTEGSAELSFGLALHLGDVAYGNIGGATRLDFTCIGPAVNLASRIEGLTGRLAKRVLLSEAFATAATFSPTALIGSFELKGVDGAPRIYEPQAE